MDVRFSAGGSLFGFRAYKKKEKKKRKGEGREGIVLLAMHTSIHYLVDENYIQPEISIQN